MGQTEQCDEKYVTPDTKKCNEASNKNNNDFCHIELECRMQIPSPCSL
jgi:hypothetical protein